MSAVAVNNGRIKIFQNKDFSFKNSAPSKFWYRLLQLLTIFRECLKEYVVEEETFLHSG